MLAAYLGLTDPYAKRLWNRTLIERIEIKGGQLAGVALKQPFAGLFLLASSNKGTSVGRTGHYLNSQIELAGGVLDLIRTHPDRYANVGLGESARLQAHHNSQYLAAGGLVLNDLEWRRSKDLDPAV